MSLARLPVPGLLTVRARLYSTLDALTRRPSFAPPSRARALVYDTQLMHGDGDDPDGLPALLEQARKAAGGTPAIGVDERAWFSAFLRIRRAVLAHAHDPATRKAWAEAVGRADVFRTLAEQGNWDLHGPIVVTGEYAATIP